MMRFLCRALAPLLLALVLVPAGAFAQESPVVRRQAFSWAPDGIHLAVDGVAVDARTGEPVDPSSVPASAAEEPTAPDRGAARERAKLALEAARVAPLPANALAGQRSRSTLPRAPEVATGLQLDDQAVTGAIVLDGQLWVWRDGSGAVPVGADGLEGVRHFTIAPDGKTVAYIDGFDLALARTEDGRVLALTQDGGEEMFHGELDWVYQEELYGRFDFRGAWWSPTGNHLAFISIDESGVDTFTVTDYRPQNQTLEPLKYPKAGTTNPRARLSIAHAADGAVVPVDLGAYNAADGILIVRVGWSPKGEHAYAFVQDREQTWCDLLQIEPDTGNAKKLLRDSSPGAWVDRPPELHWLSDGTFLFQSARTGFEHLYRYNQAGTLIAAVTHGDWRVRGIERVDEAGGWIAVSGSAPEYAIGDTVWRAQLDGSDVVRITQGRGHWKLDWNGDGSLALARMEHMGNPGATWILSAAGEQVRQVAQEELPADLAVPNWHQVETRDGEWIDVVVTLPADFDPEQLYPVWLDTYAGPDSPSITDRFRRERKSADWYVGLSVNVRSASGRGMKYTAACYQDFGASELRDLEDAVAWLVHTHAYCDPARVAISGWSYGGFIAAYALLKSNTFHCAVAGGGVYDWALYDTIYTERYMRTPANNPRGYANASVIAAAKKLERPLLIVHGAMDDNVHVQNAFQLVLALQEAGSQSFEMMLYPTSRHGVRSNHWTVLRERFLREHLGGARPRG